MGTFQLGSDNLRAQVFVILVKVGFLLFLLPLHNLVKAYVALAFGDKTPFKHGADSLNIALHVDRGGIFALLLFGYCWSRPIRTNFRENSKHPKLATIVTALSGPLTYFILAVATTFIYAAIVPKDLSYVFGMSSIQDIYGVMSPETMGMLPENVLGAIAPYSIHGFFYELTYILLTVCFVNLIPFRPFDGGEVFETLIPVKAYVKLNQFMRKHEAVASIITILFIGVVVSLFVATPVNYVFAKLSQLFLPIFN